MKLVKDHKEAQEERDTLEGFDVLPIDSVSALVDEWIGRSRSIARLKEAAVIKRMMASSFQAENKDKLLAEASSIEGQMAPIRGELKVVLARLGDIYVASKELRESAPLWQQLPANLREVLGNELAARGIPRIAPVTITLEPVKAAKDGA